MLVLLRLNPGGKAGKQSAGVRWMKYAYCFVMAQSSAQTALNNRVAIALSEAAQAALLAWEPISSCHSSLFFYLDAEEELKDSFMMTSKVQSIEFPQGTCELSQGTGVQDPVPWI